MTDYVGGFAAEAGDADTLDGKHASEIGGGGAWKAVHEGTISTNSAGKASFTLSQSYEKVYVDVINLVGTTTSAQWLDFRFNSWSDAGYGHRFDDGSTGTAKSQIPLVSNSSPVNNDLVGSLEFTGTRMGALFSLKNNLNPITANISPGGWFNTDGANSTVTATTISGFEIYYRHDSNITMNAEVYGIK